MKIPKRLGPIVLMAIGLVFSTCEKVDNIQLDGTDAKTLDQSKLKIGDPIADLEVLTLQIKTMLSEGSLSKGNGNALSSKLSAALKSLEKGKTTAANGQLGAFINQVEAYISNGVFTFEQGQDLIAAAENVINGYSTEWACGDPLPVDLHGISYNTVPIGNQCWMAENLKYLPEGNLISEPSYSEPRYYVYDYTGHVPEDAMNKDNYNIYGVLYNWPAALTACPNGWHLPDDSEWDALINNLGGSSTAGLIMKEIGTEHWAAPNNATNTSGFSALPAGFLDYNGTFSGLGFATAFWSTSPYYDYAWVRAIYSNNDVTREEVPQNYGLSVRCLQNN